MVLTIFDYFMMICKEIINLYSTFAISNFKNQSKNPYISVIFLSILAKTVFLSKCGQFFQINFDLPPFVLNCDYR